MRLRFRTNDYLLAWNLLFGASFSQSVHEFKHKLYKTHKAQYATIQKDAKEMFKDIKNFIPDNDTLYNRVFDTELFANLKEDTEKHRTELLKIWDKNKNEINKELRNILKFSMQDDYNVIVLHPIMDTVLTEKNCMNIGWGFKRDLRNPELTLTKLVYNIVKNELGTIDKKYKDIVNVVLELAIQNELYYRMSGKSTFQEGDSSLTYLKRQIYPYFLMYLGAEKEDFTSYMMRDGITFDIEKYQVIEKLKSMNLLDFIEFCIEYQWKIVRINQLEII